MVEVIDNNIQNSIVKIAVGTPKNLIKQTIENCSILECLAKAVIYTVLLGNLHVVVLLD